MKIVHVTHSFFPYSYGGRERMVFEWCRCIKNKNKVKIFTSSDKIFKTEIKNFEGIKVYYLPSITIPLLSSIYRIPLLLFFFLLKEDFDICHIHDFHHFTSLISVFVCRIKRKPVILSYHGIYKNKGILSLLTKIYELLFLKLIKNSVKVVIVSSNFSKREVISLYKIDKNKVVKIPNFISSDLLKCSGNFKEKYGIKKYILTVGRFSYEKGFEHLLRAFELVSEEFKNLTLVLIGGKRGYLRVVKKLIHKLNLENRVFILVNASNEDVYSAFKNSAMVVIPSIYEPFGITALEAMFFGKPIVAFNVGGLKEIIKNGKNGILVKPRNFNGLKNAIVCLLRNRKVSEKLGKGGKLMFKKFERKRFERIVSNFYKSILEGRK